MSDKNRVMGLIREIYEFKEIFIKDNMPTGWYPGRKNTLLNKVTKLKDESRLTENLQKRLNEAEAILVGIKC